MILPVHAQPQVLENLLDCVAQIVRESLSVQVVQIVLGDARALYFSEIPANRPDFVVKGEINFLSVTAFRNSVLLPARERRQVHKEVVELERTNTPVIVKLFLLVKGRKVHDVHDALGNLVVQNQVEILEICNRVGKMMPVIWLKLLMRKWTTIRAMNATSV